MTDWFRVTVEDLQTGDKQVIEALTTIRQARRMSRADLAQLMGTHQSWVSEVETGVRADPQFSTIVRMSVALGVTGALTIYDPWTRDWWLLPITPDRGAA